MAEGKGHAIASVAIGGIGAGAIHSLQMPGALSFGIGSVMGILLSPDLDMLEGSYSFHVVRSVLGKTGGFAWRLLWLPYAAVVKHRSRLSHWPVLGTTIRIFYLMVLFLVVLAMSNIIIATAWDNVIMFITSNLETCLLIFAGLVGSDITHFLLDR